MTHEIRLVRLLTRQLYKEIESQPSWHSPFQLPKEAADELNFWLENITERNGFTFKPRPTTTKVVFTDASSTGYGGFIAQRLSETLCVGKFNETDVHRVNRTRTSSSGLRPQKFRSTSIKRKRTILVHHVFSL